MPNQQVNEQGQVAIKFYQTLPRVVRVGGVDYAFVVRANICLAWINSEHVGIILAMKHKCCGDSYNQAYFYANESDVRRWTNNGGR